MVLNSNFTNNYGNKATSYNPEINKVVNEIVARGNDVEMRTCREGIKIFEVSKKVVTIIPHNNNR